MIELRCLIFEATICAVVGQQHITRVVEDHDSGEIIVLCSTVADFVLMVVTYIKNYQLTLHK
jgi:hypothetical protein